MTARVASSSREPCPELLEGRVVGDHVNRRGRWRPPPLATGRARGRARPRHSEGERPGPGCARRWRPPGALRAARTGTSQSQDGSLPSAMRALMATTTGSGGRPQKVEHLQPAGRVLGQQKAGLADRPRRRWRSARPPPTTRSWPPRRPDGSAPRTVATVNAMAALARLARPGSDKLSAVRFPARSTSWPSIDPDVEIWSPEIAAAAGPTGVATLEPDPGPAARAAGCVIGPGLAGADPAHVVRPNRRPTPRAGRRRWPPPWSTRSKRRSRRQDEAKTPDFVVAVQLVAAQVEKRHRSRGWSMP